MGNQIEIKSFFGNWQKVDKEKAKKYVKNILQGATAMPFEKKLNILKKKN